MESPVKKMFSDPALNAELEQQGRSKSLKQGEVLISPGEDIFYIPLVLKGNIRILREDEEGRETFLYHIYPGEVCALSLTCCQSGKKSMVRGIAEVNSEVLLIPAERTSDWYRFPEWKAFVSANYRNRFEELIRLIDLVAFHHMDKQLQHYLEERCRALNTRILEVTHQQVADELNAHREAISRLLRTMEKAGMVRLGRNTIEVLTLT